MKKQMEEAAERRMMTTQELIRELRKPGKVLVPVVMAEDVCHIKADKEDLILYLQAFCRPNAPAPWTFYGETRGGSRWLDVQS